MCSFKCWPVFFSPLGSRAAPLAPFEALPVGGYGHGCRFNGDGSPRLQLLGGSFKRHKPSELHELQWKCFFWIGWDLQILCFQGSNLRVLGFDIVGMHFNFWDYMVPLVVFNPPRTVLVCLVALANNCLFVLEQPAQSLAGRWHRFEWLINHVAWAPWLDFVRVRIWVY